MKNVIRRRLSASLQRKQPRRTVRRRFFGIETLESRRVLAGATPVAETFESGRIAVDTDVEVRIADLVDEFGSDVDDDLTTASLTFGMASIDGVGGFSQSDVGFRYEITNADDGVLFFDTNATVFDTVGPGQGVDVEIAFTVSDGNTSDDGVLTFLVSGSGKLADNVVLTFIGPITTASEALVSAADDGTQSQLVITTGGVQDVSDTLLTVNNAADPVTAFDDLRQDDTLLIAGAFAQGVGASSTAAVRNFSDALASAFGTNAIAVAVATNDSSATTAAGTESDASSLADNNSSAIAIADADSSSTTNADDNSVTYAEASNSSSSVATSDGNSESTAISEDYSAANSNTRSNSISNATAIDGSAAAANAANDSQASSSATEGSAAESTADRMGVAVAVASNTSNATATAFNGSDADSFAENIGQATSFADRESSATASAEIASIADSIADRQSSSVASAQNSGTALADADNSSIASADAENDSTAEATADGGSAASATAEDNSEATALAENGSVATSTATNQSTTDATSNNASIASATADLNSTSMSDSDDGSSATAFATGSSEATATALHTGVANSVATNESDATTEATLTSDATATADRDGSATATANDTSSASSTADRESAAVASADEGGTSDVSADNGSVASADAQQDSAATASADLNSVASANAVDDSSATATANDGSVAGSTAARQSTAESVSDSVSAASATADDGTIAEANATQNSSSSVISKFAQVDGINAAGTANNAIAVQTGLTQNVVQGQPAMLPFTFDESNGELDFVELSGFPTGTQLSEGQTTDNGVTWRFVEPPTNDIVMTLPASFSGSFLVDVRTQNTDDTTALAQYEIDVEPVQATQLTINNTRVIESDSGVRQAQLTITRSDNENDVSVLARTIDNTATAGEDFEYKRDEITFAAGGELTKTFTVDIFGDTDVENDERIVVRLFRPRGAEIADATGIIRIVNDDAQPALLTINNTRVIESDSGVRQAELTITRSHNLDDASVLARTIDNTATAGEDFEYTREEITFAAGGELTKTFTVDIFGDTDVEDDERIVVRLFRPRGIEIDDATGIIKIVNDDVAPVEGRLIVQPLVVGQNTLILTGEEPGAFSAFTMGTSEGSTTFDDYGVTVDIDNAAVPVIGVADENGNATVVIELTAEQLAGPLFFQAFGMAPASPVSNLVRGRLAEDVNGDSAVTALDALLVINNIQSDDGPEGEYVESTGNVHDVNGDGRVTALDALRVINHLGRDSQQIAISPQEDEDEDDDLLQTLAKDEGRLF